MLIGAGIAMAHAGKQLHIRRLPAIDAIEEAVGRATEMGRPMLFVPGLAGIDVPSFQAVAIAGHIAKLAARYRTRIICLLYTSPSPRDRQKSRMPSSA